MDKHEFISRMLECSPGDRSPAECLVEIENLAELLYPEIAVPPPAVGPWVAVSERKPGYSAEMCLVVSW